MSAVAPVVGTGKHTYEVHEDWMLRAIGAKGLRSDTGVAPDYVKSDAWKLSSNTTPPW